MIRRDGRRWVFEDGRHLPVLAGGSAMFTTDQVAYRGYADDAAMGSATAKANENTGWTQAVDENFRVRFALQETAGAGGNFVPQLQYNLGGAGWNNVGAASSVVRSSASGNVADGAATANLIGGTGTFAAGAFDEVDGLTGTHAVAASGHTEVEFCVQLRSADVADGNTVQLRCIGKTNATTALDAYTQVPSLTVSVPPPANPVHAASAATAYVGGGSTSMTVTQPAGVVAGSTCVVQIGLEYTTASPPSGLTAPSSGGTWTQVGSDVTASQGTDTILHRVYEYRAAGSGETWTFTWTGGSDAHASAHRITGTPASGSIFDATTDHEVAGASSTNAPATQLTTGGDDRLLIWFADGYQGASSWTPPTDFTEAFEAVNLTAAWKVQATAGDTGSVGGSSAGSDVKIAFLGSIKPEGGDATVTPNPVAATAAFPQVGVGVGAAPAVAAGTAVLPQAGVGVGATVVPVAATTTAPQTNIGVGATPAPVAAAAALPQAAAGESGATVTPAALPAVTALPQASVGVGATPAPVAGAATLPQASVAVGATPAPVAATVALPLAAPGESTAVTPAVIEVTTNIGLGSGIDVGATPTTIPVVVTLPQATPDGGGGNATASPSPVDAAAAVLQAAISVGAAPSPVAAAASLPQAAVAVGVTPAVVAAVAAILQPAVGVGVAPSPLAAVAGLPQATPDGGAGTPATVTPSPVAAVVALPQAAVGVGVAPAVTALAVALPTATIAIHAFAQPAAVALVATLPQPAVSVGAAPAPVAVVIAVLAPERVGPPFEANINPAGPVIVGVITVDPDAVPGTTVQRGGIVGGIG